MSTVYSPTQTAEWSRCPFLWHVTYRQGWRPRVIGARDVAALVGQAFGVGMAVYNKVARLHGLEAAKGQRVVACAVRAAHAVYRRTLEAWAACGLDLSGLSRAGDVQEVLSGVLPRVIAGDPTPIGWQVVAVERPSEEHGRARADVVYRTPDGTVVVRDYKFTLHCPTRYIPERLEDYANHPQAYHYLWQHGATVFIPTLVVAQPFGVHELPRTRTREEIEQWLTSQRAKWAVMEQMEKGEVPVWKADSHKTQYGKCPLYEFCIDYEGKVERLPAIGFVQVGRG